MDIFGIKRLTGAEKSAKPVATSRERSAIAIAMYVRNQRNFA